MFCHSCGKKISSRSIFCKYCGVNQKNVNTDNKDKAKKYVWTCFYCNKEFETNVEADKHEVLCANNPKNNKFYYNSNPRKAWFILWVTTMLVFGITLFISVKYVDSKITLLSGEFLLGFFLFNILMGVFAFLAMAISKTQSSKKVSSFVKNILLICLIYLIISPAIFASEGYRALHNPEYAKKYSNNLTPSIAPTSSFSSNSVSSTITPIPSKKIVPKTNTNTTSTADSGSVECIGPDGKIFNTSLNECKSLNEKWGKTTDYYVNCTVDTNCGGGTKRIKKSECNGSTCCRINGSYVFTLNTKDCVDNIIKCSISPNCGGGYKDMRLADCNNMTCCQVNGTWVLRSKGECNNEQKSESYNDWVTFCKSLYFNTQTGQYESSYFDCLKNFKY